MFGQIVSDGVPLFSGYGMRTLMYLVFFVITFIYVMFYAKRVIKDSANSVMNNDQWLKELDEQVDGQVRKGQSLHVSWQDVAVLSIVIIAPMILAIGNTVLGWAETYGNGTFIATFAIAFVICYLLKRKSIDEMIQAFTKGVSDMVIVAVAIIWPRRFVSF